MDWIDQTGVKMGNYNHMILTVKQLEKLEAERLAPYATVSAQSKGRKFKEKDETANRDGDVGGRDAIGRLCFQKDRDRIIHCKAFRRLDEKAQVFPAFFGDHYRTRLTHTLEVAQISRDIARRLGLNEDLSEAIALAHDLGHPPFGHTGEDALNEIMGGFEDTSCKAGDFRTGTRGHFEHNEQSRRVVEKLEKLYPDFDGLNLSIEVLEGLEKHKTSWDRAGTETDTVMHFEGQVVNLADEIAYTNHDIDDGLRSGVLKISDLEGLALWKEAKAAVENEYGAIEKWENGHGGAVAIARIISRIISLMIVDICENFNEVKVAFSAGMNEKVAELRKVLYEKFYLSSEVRNRLEKGKKMIKELFNFYLKNPEKVPAKYRDGERIEVAIKDYIAGMTDKFLGGEVERNLGIKR
jgi:dGTPase